MVWFALHTGMLINHVFGVHCTGHMNVIITVQARNPHKNFFLSDNTCQDYLEEFQKQFVLAPTDKTSNNILIVCKKILPRHSAKRS